MQCFLLGAAAQRGNPEFERPVQESWKLSYPPSPKRRKSSDLPRSPENGIYHQNCHPVTSRRLGSGQARRTATPLPRDGQASKRWKGKHSKRETQASPHELTDGQSVRQTDRETERGKESERERERERERDTHTNTCSRACVYRCICICNLHVYIYIDDNKT